MRSSLLEKTSRNEIFFHAQLGPELFSLVRDEGELDIVHGALSRFPSQSNESLDAFDNLQSEMDAGEALSFPSAVLDNSELLATWKFG
ncbi:hypothetical protein CDAR_390491 [Caerostris darwini]|uniref:Uncharacterized protein n=1 Tax=Caerostris darwini TaxID=1538125 RepID=A0AAV4P1K5_9ARAC|nr:hypothetical protein CDAR_390491 [Caerostris darwini]